MTLNELLGLSRAIWRGDRLGLPEISTCVAVVCGDLARQARAANEGQPVDLAEAGKELGNLILSAVRWCDDLGLDPSECIAAAAEAQRAYAAARRTATDPNEMSGDGDPTVPDAAVTAYLLSQAESFGYSRDPDGEFMKMWTIPSSFERVREGLAAAYPVLAERWQREHPCAAGCALEHEAGQITDEQLEVWEREILDGEEAGALPPDTYHQENDRG